ncbi:RAD55 (YDR076W) [Zygosaccharomyces parabailii]|uniref:ZYBA0S05-08482g1_1 n=1 Tax=Zygosaccharomyces bailii (strain CLIB 213 / ATCC 58445 / CBS 680 / BCRC 21525 / NBRC 1098 / NCYC 1416 / NRRL Y-2227) TaxID=1333698 RepID=A0A8J2X8L0_ZYGB2|nr:RAD55 (YDR076W) [Zygosaccharomyces parabailii]CDF90078.1 ZYBA0S05-08482g1_1 [Zygosaccharomyces bailii CLIB 213]
MDLGISLSQLASQRPVSTCNAELDALLGGGFHPRCIYEIYGPPGVGKTTIALAAAAAATGNALYIHTHKPLPPKPEGGRHLDQVRITRFGQLLFFLQRLHRVQRHEGGYAVLIIDGFAQLVQDHIHHARKPSATGVSGSTAGPAASLHDYKCRHLAFVLTLLTRYAAQCGTAVLLVDHCLPAQRELRSALEAGAAAGGRDAVWKAFLKQSMGVYREWSGMAGGQQTESTVAGNSSSSSSRASSRASSRTSSSNGTSHGASSAAVVALVRGHRVRLRCPPMGTSFRAYSRPHACTQAEANETAEAKPDTEATAESETVLDSQ